MRRRLLALLTALLTSGAVLVCGATPADAACPTAGSSKLRSVWQATNTWVEVTTYWVDCGSYKRLQGWRYDDETNVRRTYGSSTYGGNPATWWFNPNGIAVNAVNGLDDWWDNGYIALNNAACTEPCTVTIWGRGDFYAWLDDDFIESRNF